MDKTRRDFIRQSATLGIASSLIPSALFSNPVSPKTGAISDSKLIWADLLHLSTNMWEDHPYLGGWRGAPEDIYKDDFECKTCKEAIAWGMRGFRPFLVFDEHVWDRTLQRMADAGMNMVIIDLGDGVKYESHPEIAVRGAWSVDKLRTELAKIRQLGMEPIPKLNFATTHDAWMGEYSRMVSTTKYYSVCKDLINEVIDLFDTPRFFHLGMDEETIDHQRSFKYAVIRQGDLWWNDLYFYLKETEKRGVRPWIWSDYGWHHTELFFKKMPKSVLQSNWYYGAGFNPEKLDNPYRNYLKFYNDLEAHGYDQVPTGSNWTCDTNMEDTVDYCKINIDPARLLGFMTAPWLPTLGQCLEKQIEAIAQIENAKKRHYK